MSINNLNIKLCVSFAVAFSWDKRKKSGLVSLCCPLKFFDAKQALFPFLWCAKSMTVPISWAQHTHPSLCIKKWRALIPKDVRACANTSAESIPVDGKKNTAGSCLLRQSGVTKTYLILPQKQIFLQSPCPFYLGLSPPYSRRSEIAWL